MRIVEHLQRKARRIHRRKEKSKASETHERHIGNKVFESIRRKRNFYHKPADKEEEAEERERGKGLIVCV